MHLRTLCLPAFFATLAIQALLIAQEKSVRPGINDSFRDPNVKEFVERFEVESREVFNRREEILKACDIQSGQTVADIGAGTGIFTRLFSKAVGNEGNVIAVDISKKFLDHIEALARQQGQTNIGTLLCTENSTQLPADSVDVAYICDTYHHFEYPNKTMDSLFAAMKPGGRVILVDFKRIEGESSEWTMTHVRAGQEVFEAEVLKSGFIKLGENKELLKDNYFVVFQKPKGKTKPEQSVPAPTSQSSQSAPRRGPGPPADIRADQDIFHYLLENHRKIRRQVTKTDNGVETLTESDSPEVAIKIQQHVLSMHRRIIEGKGLRFWDDLFAAIFKQHTSIKMEFENTANGVKVVETSNDPVVVALIQTHADVVSLFVKNGFDEAEKNHSVPKSQISSNIYEGTSRPLSFPIVEGFGGVRSRPDAAEQPRAGAKVVFDVTADVEATELNKGLDRVARLLNIYGSAGLKSTDLKIAVVLHGESTKATLSDIAYKKRFEVEKNPNLPLIQKLHDLGVEIYVCGQALNYKHFDDSEVVSPIQIASAALTVLTNKQMDGFSYIPIP